MTPFDWNLPYPGLRQPVLARRVVATSQPLAAQAGLEMMRRGGSAADAAIAAAAALTVVEPTSNGLGSDAFALAWSPEIPGLLGLNASGRSPAAMDGAGLIAAGAVPATGWAPVTVPGAVSGWGALHARLGRLPFAESLEPAIRYAREGFPVSPWTAESWARAPARFAGCPGFAEMFLPDGRPPSPGQIVSLPGHARTLERLAERGPGAFYDGEIAAAIDAASRAGGGWLRASDLAAHRPDWVRPISWARRGWRLHELPPNGQGIAALIALGALDPFDLERMDPDGPEAIHLQLEAMKLGFADAHRYVTDPDWLELEPADLLEREYLEALSDLIHPNEARDPAHGEPRPGGTVLLIATDDRGEMVSFIQSNYMGFGSGAVVPGWGIALQNRGRGFTPVADHPNRPAAGKRPYHTIIPGFVTREGPSGPEPAMAFGVMGGPMQPQGHLQVFLRVAAWGQNPQAALDAPRWRVEAGRRVLLEPGWPEQTVAGLRARGHEIEVAPRRSVAFGGGQAIWRLPGGAYLGASDLRRDGQAAGF